VVASSQFANAPKTFISGKENKLRWHCDCLISEPFKTLSLLHRHIQHWSLCTLPTQCIYVFSMLLTPNHYSSVPSNGSKLWSLWGTNYELTLYIQYWLLLVSMLALPLHFIYVMFIIVGLDSSVGIATRYGLDGPGIESRWGARFSAPIQTGHGAHPASYTMGTGSFPGVKRPGRGVGHRPPSGAEVKGIVELYLYYPSGPSWPVLGWTLCSISEHFHHELLQSLN